MNNSFLHKLSFWVTAKSNISRRIDFLLLTIVTFLRAITFCSAFIPDCGLDNSASNLIGDVYCLNTKCLGKRCLHKTLLNILAEAIINVRNVGLCARCAIFLLKIKQTAFLSLGQGVYNFEESPKPVQDVIGDVYRPGKYCLNRENCETFGGFVTTPRSIKVVEIVEPSCFLTKFLSRYKSA